MRVKRTSIYSCHFLGVPLLVWLSAISFFRKRKKDAASIPNASPIFEHLLYYAKIGSSNTLNSYGILTFRNAIS